ncbi:type IV pilin protein [Amphritea sp.]|uniref:type IV pilin protein n=1 Tax=Amphritea sp. TaxID=1872502 RepID=UPI003A8DB6DF
MIQIKQEQGFTLIELMIVVAIVGIISAIAYPSYREQVAQSRRVDAQGSLTSLAQFLERHYTVSGAYTGAALPFNESPRDGTDKYYDLSVPASTATTYTLRAAPKNGMAGDRCGNMTLTHTGQKGAAETDCW